MAITKTESGKLRNSNKVVTDIGVDNVPTTGSDNLVTSDGIAGALDNKADKNNIYTKQESDDKFKHKQTAVNDPTAGNTPASAFISGITQNANGEIDPIKSPLPPFQAPLTFDNTPTEGSSNPVTSDGIKQAIDAATPSDYDAVKAQVQQNTTDIGTNTNAITGINAKIPAQASAQNQLADKEFVNSSIQTNTATFRGTYNLVSDLGLTVSATEQQTAAAIATHLASLVPPVVPENNDYVFVQIPRETSDPTVVVRYDRYKCTVEEAGSVVTRTWSFEFSLNNSSFTADQWATINSGITSGDVAKLGALPTAQELAAALLAKYEKPLTGIPKSDLASDVQTSLGKADTAIQTVKVNGAALTPDANKAVDVTVPVKATTAPMIAGTAAIGDSEKFAAENHVHPAETKIAAYALPDDCFPVTYTFNGKNYTVTSNDELGFSTPNDSVIMMNARGDNAGIGMFITSSLKFIATNVQNLKFNGISPVANTSPTLRDDAVYVRDVQVAKPSDIPVTSVNGKTGAVSLTASDVDALGNSGTQTLNGHLDSHGQTVTAAYDSNRRVEIGKIGIVLPGVLRKGQGKLGYVLELKDGTNRECSLYIDDDGKVYINTPSGYVEVPNATAGGTLALLSQIYAAVQQIAPEWSSSTSYAQNALVSYRGVVYRKTSSGSSITLAPSGDTDNWEAKKVSELLALLAPLASPAFTGTPTAPTPTAGDDSTKVATTAFVKTAIAGATPNLDYVMRVDPETGNIYYTTPDTNA